PDYAEVVRELSRKGVTRRLLWSEYRDRNSDGVGYSVFCDELAAYQSDRDLAYRHDHVPGEKAYFDFAGLTLRYRDGSTVSVRPPHLPVAVPLAPPSRPINYRSAGHGECFGEAAVLGAARC